MSKTRGAFIYPPSNTSLVFNYLDTVNVTWNTYAKYTANASLQLLIAEGAKNDFIPVYGANVSASGFASVPLNKIGFATTGHFEISFSGNQTGYGSNKFNISYNPSQHSTTWNMPTQTEPIFTTTSTAESEHSEAPSEPSTAIQMPDYASTTAMNRPSTGAIVGIVIACLFFLAVVLLVIWAIKRAQRTQPSRDRSFSTNNSTDPSERTRRRRTDAEKQGMVHELWAGEVATELEAEGIGSYDRRNAFVERSRFNF